MVAAFNKISCAWIDDISEMVVEPTEDWIVDPVFDDPDNHVADVPPRFWTYPGGSTIYVMTTAEIDSDPTYLAEVKLAKRDEINNFRGALLYGGFTDSNAIQWNSTPTDIQNLNAVITLITAGAITGSVTWTDLNNVPHSMAPAAMVQLGGELAVFGQTCYAVSWVHKNTIEALTSVAAVQAYDYSAGWPAA